MDEDHTQEEIPYQEQPIK